MTFDSAFRRRAPGIWDVRDRAPPWHYRRDDPEPQFPFMTTFSDSRFPLPGIGCFQDLLQINDVSRIGQFTLAVLRAPTSNVRLCAGSIRAG